MESKQSRDLIFLEGKRAVSSSHSAVARRGSPAPSEADEFERIIERVLSTPKKSVQTLKLMIISIIGETEV